MITCPIVCLPSSKYFPFPGNYPSPDSLIWNLIHREWTPRSQSSSNVTLFQGNMKHRIQIRKTGSLSWEFGLGVTTRFSLSLDGQMVPTGTRKQGKQMKRMRKCTESKGERRKTETQNPNGMPTLVPCLSLKHGGILNVPHFLPTFRVRKSLPFKSSRILVTSIQKIPK